MRKGLTSAGALLAAVVALLRARPRLPGQRWSLTLPGAAVAILALTGSATPALAVGPSGPVVADPGGARPRGLAYRRGVRDLSRHRRVADGRWRTHAGRRRGLRVHAGRPGLGGRAPSCVHPTPKLATSSAAPWPSRVPRSWWAPTTTTTRARRTCSRRTSSGWHLSAELAGADDRPGSGFGYSVAIGAGTIVVGAPMPVLGTGTAYVFTEGPLRLA